MNDAINLYLGILRTRLEKSADAGAVDHDQDEALRALTMLEAELDALAKDLSHPNKHLPSCTCVRQRGHQIDCAMIVENGRRIQIADKTRRSS